MQRNGIIPQRIYYVFSLRWTSWIMNIMMDQSSPSIIAQVFSNLQWNKPWTYQKGTNTITRVKYRSALAIPLFYWHDADQTHSPTREKIRRRVWLGSAHAIKDSERGYGNALAWHFNWVGNKFVYFILIIVFIECLSISLQSIVRGKEMAVQNVYPAHPVNRRQQKRQFNEIQPGKHLATKIPTQRPTLKTL